MEQSEDRGRTSRMGRKRFDWNVETFALSVILVFIHRNAFEAASGHYLVVWSEENCPRSRMPRFGSIAFFTRDNCHAILARQILNLHWVLSVSTLT